jgi:hypothetical protein
MTQCNGPFPDHPAAKGSQFETDISIFPAMTHDPRPANIVHYQTPSRVVVLCKRLSIRHILSHTHLPFLSKLCASLHSAMTGDTCVGDLSV